jgi:hypothetical protein
MRNDLQGKAEPQDLETYMKRVTMVKGKMHFPPDVDPADCDWDELPESKADATSEQGRKVCEQHGKNGR